LICYNNICGVRGSGIDQDNPDFVENGGDCNADSDCESNYCLNRICNGNLSN
jgi:hypothetical protein